MLLQFLLLDLLLCIFTAGADATSPQMQGMEVLEDFVEKLMEVRLRDMETRMKDEKEKHTKEKEMLEASIKDLETRLVLREDELETSLRKLASTVNEDKEEFEATVSKLRKEVERKEKASNCSSSALLTKSSLRDSPILLISAWRSNNITSPQIVTFESFVANYNNGGADGLFNLDSGVFVCVTPGYYTVSFSAYTNGHGGTSDPDYRSTLFLYKNGSQLTESYWAFVDALTKDFISVTGSRNLILHLDQGDYLELRMTSGHFISHVTLNIELSALD